METEKSTTPVDQDEWPEMDSFHTIMVDVYHPLKDSGNVRPIMARATELADEAEKWSSAALPEKVNNAEVKELLMQLKVGTRQLADRNKEGKEEVVRTQLHELHELFHKIQEEWYGGGSEHHDH